MSQKNVPDTISESRKMLDDVSDCCEVLGNAKTFSDCVSHERCGSAGIKRIFRL